jgi:hypothetical protein
MPDLERSAVMRSGLHVSPSTRSHTAWFGLGRIIHDMSHAWFESVYGNTRRTHDPLHVSYERRVAEYVAQHIASWFPPPRPVVVPRKRTVGEHRAARYVRTGELIRAWESKAKRAATALKKLNRERARLARLIERDHARAIDIDVYTLGA